MEDVGNGAVGAVIKAFGRVSVPEPRTPAASDQQAENRADRPLGLPIGEAEHNARRQRRQNRQRRISAWHLASSAAPLPKPRPRQSPNHTDVGAGLTCQLRHHRTDCAGRAVRKDPLPRLKEAVLEQSLPRGEAGE